MKCRDWGIGDMEIEFMVIKLMFRMGLIKGVK